VNGCSRLLDLGAGIGFVALRARALKPQLRVLAQDDRAGLTSLGRALAARHLPDDTGEIGFSAAPLNPGGTWSGLDALLADFRPDVIRFPGSLLPADVLTEARLQGVRRLVLPFSDPSELADTRARLLPGLAALGFVEDSGGEPNGSLFLRRE
jgi:hypothetical protein